MYSYSFQIGIGQIEDEFIRKGFSLGVTKTYQIKKQMRKHNDENQNQLKIPSNRQLYAQVTKIKLELFGDVNISLAVLSQWLLEHSKIPQNEDEPYVVDYIAEINVNYDPVEIYDDEKNDAVTFDSTQAQTQIETEPDLPVVYRYFISTKRLLGNAPMQPIN